jgi:hypothetical protein
MKAAAAARTCGKAVDDFIKNRSSSFEAERMERTGRPMRPMKSLTIGTSGDAAPPDAAEAAGAKARLSPDRPLQETG